MFPKKSKKRQCQRITWHRNQGLHCVLKAIRWVFIEITATKQGTFQQITPRAARSGYHFIGHCFVTPNKCMPFLHHSPKEVHVFACGSKFGSKRDIHGFQDVSLEKHVACASFVPIHLISCIKSRPVEESTLFHPFRRVRLKTWLYRPKNPVHPKCRTRFE